MDEEAKEPPREPKKELEDTIVLGEGAIGREPEVEFQTAFGFISPPAKDNVIAYFSFSPLAAPGVDILEWGLTRYSLLKHHRVAYEWGCHAFPLTTIEALVLLSNSHMSNNL